MSGTPKGWHAVRRGGKLDTIGQDGPGVPVLKVQVEPRVAVA